MIEILEKDQDSEKNSFFCAGVFITEVQKIFKNMILNPFERQKNLLYLKHNTEKISFLNSITPTLRGGGKKRKKKTYTKPKKIKHVKKKMKLKILTYYEVKDGKIKIKKKKSPQAQGCYMAEHQDRLTCGKTGLTLVRKI